MPSRSLRMRWSACGRLLATTCLIIIALTWSDGHSVLAVDEDGTGALDQSWSGWHIDSSCGPDECSADPTLTTPSQSDERPPVSLARRQTASPVTMVNNVPANIRIGPRQSNIFVLDTNFLQATPAPTGSGLPEALPKALAPVGSNLGPDPAPSDNEDDDDDSDVTKRQNTGVQIFLSINTCIQPRWTASTTQPGPPSQLMLYLSSQISTPGPRAPASQQVTIPLIQGFANFTAKVTSPVYITVASPGLASGLEGNYEYELASSIDNFYHAANASPFLYLIDTDDDSALLVTDNLTQTDNGSTTFAQWMSLLPPFIMFAQNSNQSNLLDGMQNSYCAFSRNPTQIKASQNDVNGTSSNVKMGMVTRGLGNKPKQQFFVSGLNASTTYSAWLALAGNSTRSGAGVVGGGGTIWSTDNNGTGVSLTTKREGNCQLMYDLDFCSEVAYAVPSNPNTFSTPSLLASHYDGYAAELYGNFSRSLQLVACNTTASAQYSLAKNCTDCANAYKQWLCAVTMPRCEDFNLSAAYSVPRNMGQQFFQNNSFLAQDMLQQKYLGMPDAPIDSVAQQQTYASSFASNQSRNPIITNDIKPGPYNELLPCNDLCYSLVQSCPAQLGFGCPLPGRGLELGYGERSETGLTCSYLGAFYFINAAGREAASVGLLASGLGTALLWGAW